MKKRNSNTIWLAGLCGLMLYLGACATHRVPVADPLKVKPLTEKQRLEKDYYFSEALKTYALNDWGKAQSLFLRVIKIDPGCDACYYQLGNLYFHIGALPQAISFSESAVRLDTTNFWYKMQLARFYAVDERYDEASNLYMKLMELRPDLQDITYDLAVLYINANEPEKALDMIDQAAEKYGYSEQAAGVRIELLQILGRHEEALETLEQLAEAAPSAHYYSMLGEVYSDMGQDSLGFSYFEKALELNADFMPALFGQADYYRRSGRLNIFFDKMKAIYANETVEQKYKMEYLSMLLRMPQLSRTFSQQFDTLFMYMRTLPDTLTEPLYGSYLAQIGKTDSAVTVFKDNVSKYPNNYDAWHHYLSILYFVNKWDTLDKYASSAIQRFSGDPSFYIMQAIAQWQLKNTPRAINLLEKALPLCPVNSPQQIEIYSMLGDFYHEVKNVKKSFEAYQKVLSMDPDNIIVLNNYAYYLCLEGKQMDKAYEMSKKAITFEPNNATYLDTFGWILFQTGRAIEAKAIFRNAMLYGGKESAVILDHYADVLHALGENDLASVYWELSLEKDKNPEVTKKLEQIKLKK